MKQRIYKQIISPAIVLSMFVAAFIVNPLPALASDTQLKGTQYRFDDDCNYAIKDAKEQINLYGSTQFGKISLDGDVTSIDDVNNVQAFRVNTGTVSINYAIDIDEKLDVVDDKVKKVSNAELDSYVLSGAIIVQSSLDGENWVLDKVYTDILDEESDFNSLVFESNNVQQANGCFFRVLVAYKTEKLIEESSIWFVNTSDYEDTRWAEVYKFYLIDKDQGNTTSPDDSSSERYVFQDDNSNYSHKTETDAGYSGNEVIDRDDPHFGWSLGQFVINGFSDSAIDKNDGSVIILKNYGDKVTLWFTLQQDINKLNNKENLSINEDTDGWDNEYGIDKTNFKKGALIIQKTDVDNVVHKPVKYFNYLEANCRTGADTKVSFFEEGDYKVTLDYEIKDTEGWDSVTDYQLSFEFKIRNSNCKIFAFDLGNQNELKNNDITSNGFRLDYANSKYLDVEVERKEISFNGTSYAESTAESKMSADGREFTKEGLYEITVSNTYNENRKTEMILYVGDSSILKALSKNNCTVSDINRKLLDGAAIKADGTIVKDGEDVKEEPAVEETIEEEATEIEQVIEEKTSSDITDEVDDGVETLETNENQSHGIPSVVYVFVLIIIVYGGYTIINKKNGKRPSSNEDDKSNENKEEE